jgi:hypothetical protein
LDLVCGDDLALPSALRRDRAILDDDLDPILSKFHSPIVIFSATKVQISSDDGGPLNNRLDFIQQVSHVVVFIQGVVATI